MTNEVHLVEFFTQILGADELGFKMVVSSRLKGTKSLSTHKYFIWPDQFDEVAAYIENIKHGNDVYFSPMLFDSRTPENTRQGDSVVSTRALWADLDKQEPDEVQPPPSCVVRTSMYNHQAYWYLTENVPPTKAAELSQRIAHSYADIDTHGGLAKLMRIPDTFNYKYDSPFPTYVEAGNQKQYDPLYLDEALEQSTNGIVKIEASPIPKDLPKWSDIEVRYSLSQEFYRLFDDSLDPHADWSKRMWRMYYLMLEANLTTVEMFVGMKASKVNKFARDKRGDRDLWDDIHRFVARNQIVTAAVKAHEGVDLGGLVERSEKLGEPSFVDRYTSWATRLTDAPSAYHTAAGFMCLSALLSGAIEVRVSYGSFKPNLWFLILAGSTMTRKSTALDLARYMIEEIDDEVVLATDTTVEGMYRAVSERSGRPGLFHRDEFTSMIEISSRKDYMVGNLEQLARLYDGRTLKKVLAQKTITCTNPCLILWAGGIKDRLFSILTEEHITSGFLPRFVVVSGTTPDDLRQPLKLASDKDTAARNALREELAGMYNHYTTVVPVQAGSGLALKTPTFVPDFTQEALDRYNKMELFLTNAAQKSPLANRFLPMLVRAAHSCLKMAVLLAAARQREDKVTVELVDMSSAIIYMSEWLPSTVELVEKTGYSADERRMESIYRNILSAGSVMRSELMQKWRLSAREADAIFTTLEQRGLIESFKQGRATVYSAMQIG